MNPPSPASDSSLLPPEDQWATLLAASLRLLLAAGADEPSAERESHIEEQVRRSLQTVPAAQRARFLERLAVYFPVGQPVSAPSTNGEALPSRAPESLDDVAAIVGEAWERFSPEQRRILRERLTAAGVVEPAVPVDGADFSEVKKSFGLAPADPVLAVRLGRLCMMEGDFLIKIDQLAWNTWKQVAPQSALKKDVSLGDFRMQLRRYLKGDTEPSDLQMAQQIERTRQLAASLLGSLSVTSRGFVKRYQTRYAPDAVRDIVKMEGGIGPFGADSKCWRKYTELAAEINDASIQTDMQEAIARFVEDVMKAKKTGAA